MSRLRWMPNVTVRCHFTYDDCKWSDGKQKDGRDFGESFNYSVRAQWTDHAGEHDQTPAYISCTETLHWKLINAGIGKGAIADVTKIQLQQNATGWDVKLVQAPASVGIDVKDWNGNFLRNDIPDGQPREGGQQVSGGGPTAAPGTGAVGSPPRPDTASQGGSVSSSPGSGPPKPASAPTLLDFEEAMALSMAAGVRASLKAKAELRAQGVNEEDLSVLDSSNPGTTLFIEGHKKGIDFFAHLKKEIPPAGGPPPPAEEDETQGMRDNPPPPTDPPDDDGLPF